MPLSSNPTSLVARAVNTATETHRFVTLGPAKLSRPCSPRRFLLEARFPRRADHLLSKQGMIDIHRGAGPK